MTSPAGRRAADLGGHLVGEGLQLRDDLGMLRGHVGALADLGVEVIKTQARLGLLRLLAQAVGLGRQGQLPTSLADGLQVVAGEIIMGLAGRLLGLPEQDRRDVAAVDHGRGRDDAAGEGDERRQEVDGARDRVVGGISRHVARPPGEGGLAHAAFPGRALPAAQRAGAAAVRTFHQPRAVVAREDDERVLREPLLAERLQDLAYAPIDLLDPIAETSVLRPAREGQARMDRGVHRVVRQIEIERLVLVAPDEVDGLLGVHLDEAALPFPVHQLHDLFIPQQRHDRHLGGRALLQHVVRIRDAEIVVEALPGGQEFGLIAQVPLADDLGGIPFFFKSLCYSYFRRIKAHRLAREIDPGDGDARPVAPRHHLGPGNRADRGGIETGQFHALLGHAIQMGGSLLGRPVRPDVPVAHVIDENHHHVGGAGGGDGGQEGRQEDEQGLHEVSVEQSVPRGVARKGRLVLMSPAAKNPD